MASSLLSQARRVPRHPLSALFLHTQTLTLTRLFSSSTPDPKPEPEPEPIQPISYAPRPKPEPINIQPVSYAPKPKPDPEPEPQPTREEIRYMKYGSNPKLDRVVAPLPEDIIKPSEASEEVDGVDGSRGQGQSQSQRHSKGLKKVFSVYEEEKQIPFPTLINVDKKQSERTVYDLYDAIRSVKANAKRNFDETVEAHVNLGIDRRRSDLGVSGSVVLPHGTGKIVKVAVFAEGAAAEEAKEAGADIVGGDELIEEIRTSGKINFDKCIATHSMMPRVTKIGKILRGLTPNAKRGTMTNNVGGAVKEAKQGLLDFRMKDSIVHVGLGKVSFTEENLHENIGAFVNALLLAKPAGLKKTSKYAGYVNSFHLCSTMGPGFPISIQSLSKAADLYNKLHPR